MTCLCLTRNRREWLPKAIKCFLAQTYPQKELLIIADGEDVRDLLPDDEHIRLIHISGTAEIGSKRNFGCARAGGNLIAHFDDDDYSAPNRLEDQLSRLHAGATAVTGYHSMRFTDGSKWWKYEGTRDYSLGTSLLYRRDWWRDHPFPALQIGEDNQFVATAWAAKQLTTADAGEMMFATVHPGNTSPKRITDNWKLLCA